MLKISGNKILLTRGDSAYITLKIYDADKKEYELNEGDVVNCQVRTAPNTGELVTAGTVMKEEDGTIVWYLQPADTKDLEVKKYYWDAQLTTANGDVFTFITSSPFIITDEVTMDV